MSKFQYFPGFPGCVQHIEITVILSMMDILEAFVSAYNYKTADYWPRYRLIKFTVVAIEDLPVELF